MGNIFKGEKKDEPVKGQTIESEKEEVLKRKEEEIKIKEEEMKRKEEEIKKKTLQLELLALKIELQQREQQQREQQRDDGRFREEIVEFMEDAFQRIPQTTVMAPRKICLFYELLRKLKVTEGNLCILHLIAGTWKQRLNYIVHLKYKLKISFK